jgi:hypothetical protein
MNEVAERPSPARLPQESRKRFLTLFPPPESLVPGTVDANKLLAKVSGSFNGLVDTDCLPSKVRVHGARDDPGMNWALPMKPNEVLAIQCQHGSFVGRG